MNPLMPFINGTQNQSGMSSMMNSIMNIRQMMQGRDPNAVMQAFAQQNPQFAQFVRQNQGKSPEQIARENGLDWKAIQQMMR